MSTCLTSLNGVKARNKHHCVLCGEPILPGEFYDRRTGIDSGDFWAMKMHPECHAHEQKPGTVDSDWYEACYEPAFPRPTTTMNDSEPQFIPGWKELAQVPDSATHRLEIDLNGRNGWIKEKADPEAFGFYLSTHTFYGNNYEHSTMLLRRCGFNVTCANWDA